MKAHRMLLSTIVILVSMIESRVNGEPHVSLTVEGGVSLVGEHCPGTVRLFCEGGELTILRWTYNTNEEVIFFHPDDKPKLRTMPVLSTSAFVSVELRQVSQSDQANFGIFVSILTLNVSEVEQQHITDIRCGDPVNHATIQINVQLIQQSLPENPQLIDAAYESAELTISWTPSIVECPSFGEMIHYTVDLTNSNGSQLISSMHVDISVCSTVCSVSFSMPEQGNYQLRLQARNNEGVSETVTQRIFIGGSNGIPTGTTVAIAFVVFILSMILGILMGVTLYHVIAKKLFRKCKKKRNDKKIVNQEKAKTQNIDSNDADTHSYCEIDSPTKNTRSQQATSITNKPTLISSKKPSKQPKLIRSSKAAEYSEITTQQSTSYDEIILEKPIPINPNESYGQPKVSKSKTSGSSTVEVKTNVSYDQVNSIHVNPNESYGKPLRSRASRVVEASYATLKTNTSHNPIEEVKTRRAIASEIHEPEKKVKSKQLKARGKQ